MDSEVTLYNGSVSLKFNHKQHRYYVKIEDHSGNKLPTVYPSGVTSILKSLYDQTDLLDWYSSMAAGAIVKALDPYKSDELDKAFLEVYKGNNPSPIYQTYGGLALPPVDLIGLYKLGLDAPHKKSKFGKDVGTQVHDAIDRWHKSGETEASIIPSGIQANDEAAQKSFDAYIKWYNASGLEVAASEVMVYSVDHNYAGTLDRIYKRPDGKLVMGDFKTSNLSRKSPMGIRDSYWSQLGAYIVAYEEEHNVEFADAMIVNSPKKGSIKIGYASDMGVTVDFLKKVWLDDLQAAKNHKQIVKAMSTLKSRTTEN